MFRIFSNNKIELTKGDTARFSVTIYNRDKSKYELQLGDVVEFILKNNVCSTIVLIERLGPEFLLRPIDFEVLDPDTYTYEIKLTLANQEVHTIVPPSDFILKPGLRYG